MQVLLNTDPHTDGRHEMPSTWRPSSRTAGSLSRTGHRVEAHLSDATSHAKSNPDEIHCTLEARLVGLDPVVVKDHAGTAHQAIQGAVVKLKRAITTALAKHDPRRNAALPDDPALDTTADVPG